MRSNKGLFVPEEILNMPKLTGTDKLVAAQIFFLDNGNGCIAKVSTIAGTINTPVRTVSYSIKHLRELGVIVESNYYGSISRKVNIKTNSANIADIKQILPNLSNYCQVDNNINSANIANNSANIADNSANIAAPLNNKKDIKNTKKISLYSGELKKLVSIVDGLNKDDEFKQLLKDFIEMRLKDKKHPFTENALNRAINKLEKLSGDESIQKQIIETSLLNGWKGFFPLKNNYRSQTDVLAKLEKEFAAEEQQDFVPDLDFLLMDGTNNE